MALIQVDCVRRKLSYDPQTGAIKWKESYHMQQGSEAGTILANGYRQIQVGPKKYFAHRLAWLIMTGEWPEKQIDHRNGIRHDNRWWNLRAATPSQNQANRKITGSNVSGYKGVSYDKHAKKWRALIYCCGMKIHLGLYLTVECAFTARRIGAWQYHGEFKRESQFHLARKD